MKLKDLKGLNSEELIQRNKGLKKELFDLNYQRKMGRVEKPARFKIIRKDIARVLTILKERERDGRKS
ncbi:MAG: 50S ribosomal protein L29 [Candidatus Omnitrophota bacterium]